MNSHHFTVKLKESSQEIALSRPVTVRELLQMVVAQLKENEPIVGARVDSKELVDLFHLITGPCEVEFVTISSPDGLRIMRHSASHVLAQAVQELYPDARLGIGPATEEGFYYDFLVARPFSPEDLEKIEKRMHEIVKADYSFERQTMKKEEAIRFFEERGERFKVEIIRELEDAEVSIYKHNGFVDLCRGPHVPSTGFIKAFKLLSSSGAYWRGDEKRDMLQRIYGTAFSTHEDLKKYLDFLEEAKRRDHRVLGRELDLFSIQDEAGAGLVFWHPRGSVVRKIIEDLWKEEHIKRGYHLIYTPHIARIDLWATSGHLDYYRENMFSPMEMGEVTYQLKPMNCPFHILIYRSRVRSYRDLPLRFAELGTVYRFERSGVLHGLLRVRGFTQDDAHVFLTEDQLEKEIRDILFLMKGFMNVFGFQEFEVYLSTRPSKFVGSPESWDLAEKILAAALENAGFKYSVDPGEGVFYGPKIDVKVKDAIGRAWQTTTIQVDFNLPERFDLHYAAPDNTMKRPIMIHRALFGSLERFFGILVEHYAGNFPVWLAPEQVRTIPLKDDVVPRAQEITNDLKAAGLRVHLDARNETLSYRVREAETQKIPYVIVIGPREVESGTVAVRKKGGKGVETQSYAEFKEKVLKEAKIPEIITPQEQ